MSRTGSTFALALAFAAALTSLGCARAARPPAHAATMTPAARCRLLAASTIAVHPGTWVVPYGAAMAACATRESAASAR